ncbi:hypothetical protein EMIHUDRAFT_231241 [Emiliania huxleyi CCMP1516]|uniref:Uncharacterized protein n=2 Tax=Emiliania huxleyi TaxID=2903 RepID=A0A0D3K7U9_EMIH1|nr:hypothetical protein EMIHUDRAFT_231241 [Emiliania huxleyi CCMP1516]EOD31834.1 hypothetical protein EMIHUDRAFT_231241 [Emiliania huxleyi CCMP1516]|eukprot:XP_005784263.1 hypothetical protein EMIHUDRAFT_231241 [Emiliania huxleyi CCMP1516]
MARQSLLCPGEEFQNHDQHKLKHFWRLGEGFEGVPAPPPAASLAAAAANGPPAPRAGSASDYVEYVVWLLGVIGVLYFLANPNARRNWHVDERDEAWNDDAGGEGDGEEGLAEAWQPDSAGDDAAARRESSSQATFRRRGGRAGQLDE